MAKIHHKHSENFTGEMAMPGILILMREEHRMMTALMEKMHTLNTETELHKCFDQLAEKIMVHSYAEERVFYPAIADLKKTKKLTAQSLHDHTEAEMLLKAIKSQGFKTPEWKSLYKNLQSNLTEHIKTEEELLFPILRDNFTKYELENLDKRYREIKNYGLSQAS